MASLFYLILSVIGLAVNRNHIPQNNENAIENSGQCDIYLKGNGSLSCIGSNRYEIQCDGQHGGLYTCSPDKRWEPKLPYCFSDLKGVEAENCPENEEYSKCIIPCNDCYWRGACVHCLCLKGCDCKKGYFRKERGGKCIPAAECPAKTPSICQEDEEYYECTPSCKNTCKNINNPGVKCRCGPPGCFCREGLVKRSDGKCVHPKHCPRSPSSNGKASSCTLFVEGNGSVNCTGDARRNVCDVECDGEYQGAFICTRENGWSSRLPYCAREVQIDANDGSKEVLASRKLQ